MTVFNQAFIDEELSKQTSIFGLKLWVVIGVFVGAAVVLILFSISLCLTSRRRTSRSNYNSQSAKHHSKSTTNTYEDAPTVNPFKDDVKEVVQHHQHQRDVAAPVPEIQIEIGGRPDHRVVFSGGSKGSAEGKLGNNSSSFREVASSNSGGNGPEVSHLGWGRWYTLRELEVATNGLADENVVGEGGYGIVYSGVLADDTKVAVKNLLNNRGQAEKEFKVEVDAIGRVRHKNLVRLLGYCVEGAYRMLVYEYVNNGNLDQWLHGDVGEVSPLTWEIRLNIILGTARGLAYLHEGLEPRVVHRDVKSSNILLDRQWNPKVSDFGLAKLMNSESSYVSTRVMGTFGYVAPEYACTGMLNEKSDVYSFGILVMEIISGRTPVDYNRPKEEVNLVDWLKAMVGDRKSDQVVDPKLPTLPSSRALKRVLLVALKCVDPDARKRPKMGQVLHMLEADDFLFANDRRTAGESSRSLRSHQSSNPL